MLAKLLQSCLILCDPTDGSPSGFAVPRILQARTLEWVAIGFSRVLISWPQIKKIVILKCYLLLFYTTTKKEFLDRIVMCDKKWILCDNQRWPSQWLDQEEAPKHFPNPNLHQKKVMVTVWGSAAHLIHYSFLNPSETITSGTHAQQMDEMHWKLQCLQPTLFNTKCPVLHNNARPQVTQLMLQKLN